MELQETVEQSEVVDPEVKARFEKEALKVDRKRSREIWEIAGRHQIHHDMVNKAIYEDCVTVPDFRGIVLDYREKQGTASAVTVLEDTGMGLSEKEVQRFSIAKLLWAEVNPMTKQRRLTLHTSVMFAMSTSAVSSGRAGGYNDSRGYRLL